MLAVIQPEHGCGKMVKLSDADIAGSGTRTIKLHWKTTSTPEVYVSGWELENTGDAHWYMVIYKTKQDVDAGCTNSFQVEQRFAIRSRSDRHARYV
jgi:hypothetical protein